MNEPIRILVVDDNCDVCNGTARLLERAGYIVDVAADGEAALELVRQHQPNMLLLDRDMPGLDGLEVCRRIKQDPSYVNILVILASAAYAESSEQAEGLEAGADGYIARPIANRELLARVKAYERMISMSRVIQSKLTELEMLYAHANQSTLASLNLIEDAVAARDQADAANQRLLQEIDAHKAAEAMVRALSARQEAILGAIPEIIMQVDANKVYTWANPVGIAFFGDDVIGKKADYYFEGEETVNNAVQPLFEGDETVIRLESWQRRQDGEKRLLVWLCRVLKDARGKVIGALATAQDMTEHRKADDYRELRREVIECLNEPGDMQDAIQRIITVVKARTGFDAVGMRLQDGEDFPYFLQQGFPEDFLLTENTLIERGADGGVCRSKDGKACLACTCGLVISGKTDPASPLFTKGGSFWTNDSIPLLKLTDEQDPRYHPRNQCMHHGYASMALIPIRDKSRIIGLIHLNDHRQGRFTLQTVELLESIAAHMGEALVRKRTEAALQASDEQHRLLLQYLPVGVVVHASDTSILLANAEAERLLGIPMEVMQGKTAMDPAWHFVREDGSPMPLDEYPVSRVLATCKPIENFLLGVDRYIGSTRVWILVNAFPQLDEAGQVRQVEVTFIDLTERKRLEAALEQRLVALTRPLDQPDGISFTELFDLETIQRIQDEFAAATGVASVITHPDGTPITRPSNFCRLCRDIIRGTEIGCGNCYRSDSILGRHHPEGPVIQPCLSGGLWDAGASITIGNRHIANWLIGQVRDEAQSDEKMLAYARTIGADESAFLAAYQEVPSMSGERFRQIAQALFTLANQLSATAYQNIQQARFISERQRAEVALNNERLQLRTLIDNLPYSIYVKDTECRFVVANQTCARRIGVASPEELVGHDDRKFYTPEAAHQYREDELRVMRENIGIYGKEMRVLTDSGKNQRWSSATKVPIKNAVGDVIGLVGIGIDITERKRTESYREMRREIIQLLNEPGDLQEVLQRVITAVKTPTGVDVVGLRLQDGEDFPYYVQQGFPQDFLLTENTLLARDAEGKICRDKKGNVSLECTCGLVISGKTDPSSPLFTKGGSFWTNNSLPLRDLPADKDSRYHPRHACMHRGYTSMALIPIRDKEHIIGLLHLNDRRKDCFTLENVELLENIASYIGGALMRRKAEAALEKQNGLVNSLLKNLQIGVYMVEVPSGKPLLANEASFRILGRGILPESHASTISKEYALFKNGSNEPYPNEELPLVVAMKGVSKYVDDMIVVRPDGVRVALEVFGSPIKDQQGNIWASLISFQDITARKATEKAILDMAEAKAKFTSTVSHELRSPLGMIKESTNLVMEGVLGPINDEQKEMLNISKTSIERLGRLINNVLALQKIDAKKMEYDFLEQDLNEVVKEAHTNAMLFAGERKTDVMMELGTNLPRIKFDTDKIMQVLINLLANAIKYSESGPVMIQTRLENNEVLVSVQDAGQGIYPDELDEIFKPFVQAKGKKQGGTGLGLAITKEIVLEHHGRIWVESEVGKGSTFYFTLPV